MNQDRCFHHLNIDHHVARTPFVTGRSLFPAFSTVSTLNVFTSAPQHLVRYDSMITLVSIRTMSPLVMLFPHHKSNGTRNS